MTGPYIPQLRGWYDQISPGLNQLAQNIPRIINPNYDLQQAFKAKLINDPNSLATFVDYAKNDPNFAAKLGLNNTQGSMLQGQPESAGNVTSKNITKEIQTNPQAAGESAAKAGGYLTPAQRESQGLTITGQKQDVTKNAQDILKNQFSIDMQPLQKAIYEGNVAQAQDLVVQHIKRVADQKLADETLPLIGGKQQVYQAIAGKIPGINLSAEQKDALISSNKDLYEAQRQGFMDEELSKLRQSEEQRNAAMANRAATGHDYIMQNAASRAGILMQHYTEALPLPPNVSAIDVMQHMVTGGDNPIIQKYITDAAALVPSKEAALAQKQYEVESKPLITKLTNPGRYRLSDAERQTVADDLNKLAGEKLGGFVPTSKLPQYGPIPVEGTGLFGTGVMKQTHTTWGRIDGGDKVAKSNFSPEQQQMINQSVNAVKGNKDAESLIDSSTNQALTLEMRAEIKRLLKGQ